jgi:hypothetical protein
MERHNESLRCWNWDLLPALCVILAVATSIIRERFLVAPFVEVVAED